MTLDSFWFDNWVGYANNGSASSSWDLEIAPSTVYATVTMQSFTDFGGDGFYIGGISQYTKRDPQTGIDSVVTSGGSPPYTNGIFDTNVDSVTYVFQIGGSGSYQCYFTLLAFFWV